MELFEALKLNLESIIIVLATYSISLIFFGFFSKYLNSKSIVKKVLSLSIITLPICFLSALRSINTGADTMNLYRDFLASEQKSFVEVIQTNPTALIYQSLEWIISYYAPGNYHIYFFVVAFLSMTFVILGINKWKLKYSVFAYALFLLTLGPNLLNQIREMLAVSIMVYGFYYLYQKNYKVYFIISLIASLIHLSAFPMALIIFLIVYNVKNQKSNLIFLIFIIIVTVFSKQIFNLLSVFVSFTKYKDKYFSEVNQVPLGLGLLLTLIPNVLPMVFLSLISKVDKKMERTVLLTVPTRAVGYYYYYVHRLYYYASSVSIIAIPFELEKTTKENRSLVFLFTIICALVYFISFYCWKEFGTYLPYQFYWNV